MNETEVWRLIIDEAVAVDLMLRGHNLLAQLPSEVVEDRRIYVFANSPRLDKDIQRYDEATYYV